MDGPDSGPHIPLILVMPVFVHEQCMVYCGQLTFLPQFVQMRLCRLQAGKPAEEAVARHIVEFDKIIICSHGLSCFGREVPSRIFS